MLEDCVDFCICVSFHEHHLVRQLVDLILSLVKLDVNGVSYLHQGLRDYFLQWDLSCNLLLGFKSWNQSEDRSENLSHEAKRTLKTIPFRVP